MDPIAASSGRASINPATSRRPGGASGSFCAPAIASCICRWRLSDATTVNKRATVRSGWTYRVSSGPMDRPGRTMRVTWAAGRDAGTVAGDAPGASASDAGSGSKVRSRSCPSVL